MEAYLDNSATTKINDDVLALMERVYKEDFGNPSSRHKREWKRSGTLKPRRSRLRLP